MLSSRMPDFNPVDSSIGTMDVDNVLRQENNDPTVPKVSTASVGDQLPSVFTDNVVTESVPSNNNTHVVSSSSSYVRASNGDVDYRRTDSTHSRTKDTTRSTSSRYSSSGHHHRRGSRSRSPRSRSPRSRSRSSQSDSEESSDSESSPSRFSSRKSRFRSHDHRASNHQSGGTARNDDSSTSMHPPSSSYHHRSSNRHSGTSGAGSSRFGGKDRARDHDSSSGYRSNRPRRDSYSSGHHHHKPYHRSTSKQSSNNNSTSSSSGLIPVRYAERGRNHRRPSANNVITPTLDATSPYFVEPYNPESATTIDPSMLMQMLPGFLQISPQQTPTPSIPFALGRYVLQPNNNASTSITKEVSQDSATQDSPLENNPIGVVPSSYQSLKMLKKFNQSVMPCLGMGGLLLPPAMMPPPPVTRPRELVGVNISGSEPYVPKQVRRGRGRGGNNFGGNTGGFSGTRRPKRQDDDMDQTQQTSGRVGMSANDPKMLYDRSYLMLRKIPPEMNSISMLDQHFSKFGTVLNIEVCHQNDPECALVQFSCANEALAALHSTEAVFNNRFIKMFLARNDFGKNGAPQRVIHNRNQANLTVTVTANDNATLGDQQMDSQETQHKLLSPQKPASIFDRLGIQKNTEGQETVATAAVPQFKTMARAEYAAKRKELADRSKSLQETMANQKHLMGKLEAAKTPKEKTAILKLLQLNMANVKELQEACKKLQDSFKGVLQTTKVNNNRIVIAPGARSVLYPSAVATTQDVQRRPSLQDTTTPTKTTEEEEEEAMVSDDGDEVEPSTPTSTNETETTNNKLLSFAASLTDF